jgi:tagatose-6-phosphate ketose/aldose isomerase
MKGSVFSGSGALEGVAVESALKVLELTAGKILTMSNRPWGCATVPWPRSIKPRCWLLFFRARNVARYERDLLQEIMQKRLVKTESP